MEHKLDVSGLEPPEPMERILQAIETLNAGDYLHVTHRREPHMLYPMLEKMGIAWITRQSESEGYDIFLWRKGDNIASAEVPA